MARFPAATASVQAPAPIRAMLRGAMRRRRSALGMSAALQLNRPRARTEFLARLGGHLQGGELG
jgi:hypothetical protein